jgi:hypothetical protein
MSIEYSKEEVEKIFSDRGILNNRFITLRQLLQSATDSLTTRTFVIQYLNSILTNCYQTSRSSKLFPFLEKVGSSTNEYLGKTQEGFLYPADIKEAEPYPEEHFHCFCSTQKVEIGKTALAVKLTDEYLNQRNGYFVLTRLLKSAANALARHKEVKTFNLIKIMGITAFNNIEWECSLFGKTTGGKVNGDGHRTISLTDLTDACFQIMTQGFIPDVIALHPMALASIARDKEIRDFLTTLEVFPGIQPLKVVTSWIIPFNPRTKTTDIFVFDHKELGSLVEDESLAIGEFTDPFIDIKRLKLREKYGIDISHEGQQIALLLNVGVPF